MSKNARTHLYRYLYGIADSEQEGESRILGFKMLPGDDSLAVYRCKVTLAPNEEVVLSLVEEL